MGVESSNYDLTVKMPPDDVADFDMEYFMFQLLKQVPNAKFYLNEEGKATGGAGQWDSIPEDFKEFSQKNPKVLFMIEEEYQYDGTYESRHYVQNGKHVEIEPIQTWPDFNPEDLK